MKKIILLFTVFFMVCGCVCDTNNQTYEGRKTSTELSRKKCLHKYVHREDPPVLIIHYDRGALTILVDRETRVQYFSRNGGAFVRRDKPDGTPLLYDGDL